MRSLAALVFLAGTLTENVPARVDSAQTYTLVLPSGYDAAKKYPLLLVFDPRGRGTTAAEIFREGADEFGWILISSNGTRSDTAEGEADPNEPALRALWPEVARYAVDPKRIYAAGFSGTAMVAWSFGITSGGLAGVIGVGGRLLEPVAPRKFNFAHFGFAGQTDFNNRDMRAIDALLEREGKPHRFESFEGDHRWMPKALAREAIAWMELVAMKEGRRARDEATIAKEYASQLAAAGQLRGLDALRRYRAIARTFDGLHGIDEARTAIATLERDPNVQRALADEEKWDVFEAKYVKDTLGQLPLVLSTDANRVAQNFRIAELQKRATREGAEGLAARRLLETVHGQFSFYLLRFFFARREYPTAAALLTVATKIHEDRPNTWYNLGAAHARAGDRRRALDALAKSIELGYRDAANLERDEDYASVRGEERFRELLAKIR